MARLPSERYLIQQIGGMVVLFEEYPGREIARWIAADGKSAAIAQGLIHHNPEMSDEDKCFAHFWSGYFYAHATMHAEDAEEL